MYVGVAADALMSGGNCSNHTDSLVLQLGITETALYIEGRKETLPLWPRTTGCKTIVAIDQLAQSVEWRFVHPYFTGNLGTVRATIP